MRVFLLIILLGAIGFVFGQIGQPWNVSTIGTPSPTHSIIINIPKWSGFPTSTPNTTPEISKIIPQGKAKPTSVPATVIIKPVAEATISPLSVRPTIPAIPYSTVNANTRNAVVNILCTTQSGGYFKPFSGSGVIIDARGVILTNAHMGQYYLLENYKVPRFLDCSIRTGSPAVNTYHAQLLYVSKNWIEANAKNIVAQTPLGTGENDFALLLINDTTNGQPPPQSFPFVRPDTAYNTIFTDTTALLASYPAELVGGIEAQRDLNLVSSGSTIKRAYYFRDQEKDLLDIFSLGGNIVAQGGSSGGAAVDYSTGNLIGIIVTSTSGATTGEKDLKALSVSHVDRRIKEETGKNLMDFLNTDLTTLADEFASTTFPILKQKLVDVIEKQN